jgi:TonB family protein
MASMSFIRDAPANVRLLGEEEIAIQGGKRPCHVVEAEYAGSPAMSASKQKAKLWIDKATHLVLKAELSQRQEKSPFANGPVDMSTIFVVDSVKVGEPASEALFKFIPPKDAREADDLFRPAGAQKSDLVGQGAPDFTVRDLEGREVQLSRLRGKAVLLDFWATWCAPCRAEMPDLENIRKESKDTVVLGINVGEDVDTVRKFVSGNHISFPILLGGNERVVQDYHVDAYPTVVVIDKDGTVRSRHTGYGPGEDLRLRAALQEAQRPVAPPQARVEANAGPVHTIGDSVSPPQLIRKQEPSYTEEARQAKISGTVVLRTVVDPDGTAHDIKVVRSLGHGLDEKAIEAVRQWEFRPGMKDGHPVAVQANIDVNFRLLDSPDRAVATPPAGPPQSAEEAFRRGAQLLHQRRVDEGIGLLSEAIRMKPEWAQAWAARAHAHYLKKRYDEAIRDFDQAIRLSSAHPDWYNYRGLSYSYSNRHDRAIPDYTKAIELNPNAAAGFNNRGWAYLELGQPEKALADLDRAIQLQPDYQRAYENRANAYMKLQNYARAMADYTAAIELGPARWQYERRAEAKRALGDITGAEADLTQAQQSSLPGPAPTNPQSSSERIAVEPAVLAANLVKKVEPEYPELARQARVSGTVRFRVIVGKDGAVRNMQIISGHPLLIPAAQAALKQWVYKPTMINGQPMEVEGTVDVIFALTEQPPTGHGL